MLMSELQYSVHIDSMFLYILYHCLIGLVFPLVFQVSY